VLVVQSEMIDHAQRAPARRQHRSSQLFLGKTFEDAEYVVSLPFEGIQQSPSLFVHPETVLRGQVRQAGPRLVTTVAGCERAELVGLPC
jgi:hypothetical protein